MPEYYVFDSSSNQWLADDEKSWTGEFNHAACFLRLSVARDVLEREAGTRTPIVLQLAD